MEFLPACGGDRQTWCWGEPGGEREEPGVVGTAEVSLPLWYGQGAHPISRAPRPPPPFSRTQAYKTCEAALPALKRPQMTQMR